MVQLLGLVLRLGREIHAEFFEEVGVDMAGEDIMQASEVFDVGDGRYLIVEG